MDRPAIEGDMPAGTATTSPSEFVIIEVSAKSTGLGNTCAALGLAVYHRVDLVRAEDFRLVLKLLKSRPTGWLHSVPPYELAAGQWTAKGDTWMIRLAKVCKTARSAGVHISIEHTVSSQIWSHRSMIRMSSLPGVCDISCDLNQWISELRRLTTWRTSAPWCKELGQDRLLWELKYVRPLVPSQ